MTDVEARALALVNEICLEKGVIPYAKLPNIEASEALCRAINQHEAFKQKVSDAEIIAENKRLREALRTVEQGVPRLVGKSWFPDGRPSKHDQCVHGIWMYEPCEGCTDAFIAAALGETK